MGNVGWRSTSGSRVGQAEFAERGWKRDGLADWDERWEDLSIPARSAILNEIKAPPQGYGGHSANSGTAIDKLKPEVVKELAAAGFVKIQPSPLATRPDRVVCGEAAADFRTRVRTLNRLHLLDPNQPGSLSKYIHASCYPGRLGWFVSSIVNSDERIQPFAEADALMYLNASRWPEIVLKAINDPIATQVIDLLCASDQPLPLKSLAKRFKTAEPAQVRKALDALIARLAVFEDLDPKTFVIKVGLLPEVRARIAAAATRTVRPALKVCSKPESIGLETGPLVDDLRAFLLEVASDPPRLRQDGEIFSKEQDRFLAALGPSSTWSSSVLGIPDDDRLDLAYGEAETLKFVKDHKEGKSLQLQLTPRGRAWLTADTRDQYAQIYEAYRILPNKGEAQYDDDAFSLDDSDEFIIRYMTPEYTYFSRLSLNDRTFLGSPIAVAPSKPGKKGSGEPSIKAVEALREAIGNAFLALPEGVYHRLESVAEHLAFRDQNVLLLGSKQEDVTIYLNSHVIPALEEARDEVARKTIIELVKSRLIPLGAVRPAIDADGNLCFARAPRLGAYFGLATIPEEDGGVTSAGSKVIIQPDFSVVVIGLSSGALAELAPFCDRSGTGSHGSGASVLKITRESVTRAIAQGLKPQQILDRLKKHASHDPPANVLREISDWGGWVKTVSISRLTVVRCPDRETADRVAGALKQHGERLNETTLALDAEKLTSIERNKLKLHGILIETRTNLPAAAAPKRKAAKRRY